MRILALAVATVALSILACQPVVDDPIAAGRKAYVANCTVCHNTDPAKEGSIGPAIAGSPPALVEARVLRAEYPPGYTPKRESRLMPAQPFLKADVPAIAAYLQSAPP